MLDTEFSSLRLHHLAVGDAGLNQRRLFYLVINEDHLVFRASSLRAIKTGSLRLRWSFPSYRYRVGRSVLAWMLIH